MDARNSQSVLVFGATGYVGREVVRRECDLALGSEPPTQVVAHIRPNSRALEECSQDFKSMGAQVASCSWNPEAIHSLVAEHAPTHCFALLGTTRKRAKIDGLSGDIYEAVDYDLTARALAACCALEPRPRFIYLSCIGADSKSRSSYLRVRGRIESELADSDLPYVSARPAIITGADRDGRPMERAAAAVGNGALRLIAGLGGKHVAERYSSTTSSQLADALVHLAHSDAKGIVESEALREWAAGLTVPK